jgi:hypothetical protein
MQNRNNLNCSSPSLNEIYTMKNILQISLLSLAAIAIAFPASARDFQGPRGTTAQGQRVIFQNSSGGTTAAGSGSVAGFRGGSASGQAAVKTNGQGSAAYQGSGTVTTPQGQTYDGSVTGNASYNKTTGYSGNSNVTVNGKTYKTSSQNGTVQITNSVGNTQSYQLRHR